VILNPLYGGVVEELYYRGYLLPRMSNLGAWAPVVNVVLWAALIHLGQPWDVPAFIIAFLPLAYVMWWKQNVYIGIAAHTLGNLLNALMLGGMIYGI
jgi:membrane protease YdiL (CAAX protease family)